MKKNQPNTNYEDVAEALLSIGVPDPMSETLPPPNTHAKTSGEPFQHIQLGRDMQIWALRIRGFSPDQIAKHFATSRQQVNNALRRATNHITLEIPDTMIKLELDRLDYLLQRAMDVLETEHVAFSHGKVMYNPVTGTPYVDTQPVLNAIKTILSIQERRAKLMALDKQNTSENNPNDEIESELQEMIKHVEDQAKQFLNNNNNNNPTNNNPTNNNSQS